MTEIVGIRIAETSVELTYVEPHDTGPLATIYKTAFIDRRLVDDLVQIVVEQCEDILNAGVEAIRHPDEPRYKRFYDEDALLFPADDDDEEVE